MVIKALEDLVETMPERKWYNREIGLNCDEKCCFSLFPFQREAHNHSNCRLCMRVLKKVHLHIYKRDVFIVSIYIQALREYI